MVGRKLSELFPRSRRKPGEILLEANSLTGDPKPLSATFNLRRGEVLGVAGLVGSGRTELLRCLFGLDSIRSGQVRVGAVTGPGSPARRLGQGMGLLSEDRKNEGLALNLPIAENVTLSRLRGLGPFSLVLPSRQDSASAGWMKRLAIRCQGPRQKVSELSGGNQQKVALARLLHHDVDVWLLDEPTRGIDVGSKAQIYRLINDLAAKHGKAVLMVSSYLPELLGVCDRLAVMRRGKLSETRPIAKWNARSIMKEAVKEAA
jgi:ribose transport system ATP-binding protein